MIHSLFSTGFRAPERETRLCQQVPGAPGTAPGTSGPKEGFSERLVHLNTGLQYFFKEAFNTVTFSTDLSEKTRSNMMDERQWIQGFQDTLFDPKKSPAAPKGEHGPREYLLSLDQSDRALAFVKFVHAMIPHGIRNDAVKGVLLNGFPALKAKDVAGLTPEEALKQISGAANEVKIKKITSTLMLLTGQKSTTDAAEKALAMETLREFYPKPPSTQIGHLYQDYVDAVRELRALPTQPSKVQLTDVAFLRQKLPPGRLRAYMQLADEPEARARVEEVAKIAEQREKDQQTLRLQSQRDLHIIDLAMRKNLENAKRTPLENWDRQSPETQFMIGAALAVGAYFMLTSKNKAVAWTPWVLGGIWGYMTLIQGNDKALNDMLNFGQEAVNTVGSGIKGIGSTLGWVKSSEGQSMLERLSKMEDFFNTRAFEKIYPSAVAFTTLAEVQLKHLALALHPAGNGFVFSAGKGHAATEEMDGIIKRRGYDRNAVYSYINNGRVEVTRALTSTFFVLGSRDSQYQADAKEVEDARRKLATTNNAVPSYGDITDPKIRGKYINIVRRGLEMAQEKPYNGMTFAGLVETMMQTPERKRYQMDTAEEIGTYLDAAGNHKTELALYTGSNKELDKDTAREKKNFSEELVGKEWTEFLNNIAPIMLHKSAKDRLQTHFEEIWKVATTGTVQEKLQATERLKYVTLVAAVRNTALPLDQDEIDKNVIPEVSVREAGGIIKYLLKLGEGTLNWANENILTVSGRFTAVRDLNSVKAFLQDGSWKTFGTMESLNKRGFGLLIARLEHFRKKFNEARDRGIPGPVAHNNNVARAAEIILDKQIKKDANYLKRFGDNRDAAIAAIKTALIGNNTSLVSQLTQDRYLDQINNLEQYFAQRIANSVVLAFLTDHRKNGAHELSKTLEDRVLSPIEERNLVKELDEVYEKLVENVNDPTVGTVARAEVISELEWADKVTVAILTGRDVSKSDDANASHQDAIRLARLYAMIDPNAMPAGAGNQEAIIQGKIKTIVETFALTWSKRYLAQQTGIADIETPLANARTNEQAARKLLAAARTALDTEVKKRKWTQYFNIATRDPVLEAAITAKQADVNTQLVNVETATKATQELQKKFNEANRGFESIKGMPQFGKDAIAQLEQSVRLLNQQDETINITHPAPLPPPPAVPPVPPAAPIVKPVKISVILEQIKKGEPIVP